jgi:hypothetical protein
MTKCCSNCGDSFKSDTRRVTCGKLCRNERRRFGQQDRRERATRPEAIAALFLQIPTLIVQTLGG